MNEQRAARQRAKAEADRPARVDALGADVRALGLGAVEPAPPDAKVRPRRPGSETSSAR